MEHIFNVEMDLFQQDFIKLSKGIETNLFATAELLEEFAKTDTHIIYDRSNWIMLVKMNDFWKMYYSINKESLEQKISVIKSNFNELVDLIGRPEIVCEYLSKTARNEAIDLFLNELSFEFFIKRERMRLVPKDIKLDIGKESGYIIEKAEESFASEILSLYEKDFDKYTSCMPSEFELLQSMQAGHIYLLKEQDRQNDFLALLEYSKTKNKTSILHFLVKEEYRGRGLANILLDKYLREVVLDQKMRAHLWVQVKNKPAKNLYAKHGYKADQLYSIAYLFQRRN